jgi:hypothetical protein
MKKSSGIFTFLTIFLTSLVSAGPVQGVDQLLTGLKDVIYTIISFISETIFEINSFDEFLFAKLLLFVIVLLVTYTVIKKTTIFGGTKNKPIQWIISSAIAILAVRFLPDEFVQAILLQYGTLAVGITTFLPMMIFFFFIHQSIDTPTGRRMGWIVYLASFFAIWSFRYTELGTANWIYWITLVFVGASLLFDKKIHGYFGLSSIRKMMETSKHERKVAAQKKLKEMEKDHAEGYYEGNEGLYLRQKAQLEKVIKESI